MSAPTTVTIQLDPTTAKALGELAGALGLTIQEYLKQHFAGTNGTLAAEDVDRWLDELCEGLSDLPSLPADFSSKDVYADHD